VPVLPHPCYIMTSSHPSFFYCHLPTFSERASSTYIDYKLCVAVRRGGLRVNNRCVVLVLYVIAPSTFLLPPYPHHRESWFDGDCAYRLSTSTVFLPRSATDVVPSESSRARLWLKAGRFLVQSRIPKAERFMTVNITGGTLLR
jgi:hypothetical protein